MFYFLNNEFLAYNAAYDPNQIAVLTNQLQHGINLDPSSNNNNVAIGQNSSFNESNAVAYGSPSGAHLTPLPGYPITPFPYFAASSNPYFAYPVSYF